MKTFQFLLYPVILVISTSMYIPQTFASSWSAAFIDGTPSEQISISVDTDESSHLYINVELAQVLEAPLFGGAFQLEYDPAILEFVRFEPGDTLEVHGADPIYMVGGDEQNPGRLIIGFTLKRGDELIEEIGTLLTLVFQVKKLGETSLTFDQGVLKTLTKYEESPEEISNVTWPEGMIKIANNKSYAQLSSTPQAASSSLPKTGITIFGLVALSLVSMLIVILIFRKRLNRSSTSSNIV